jgi:hypothetical protein
VPVSHERPGEALQKEFPIGEPGHGMVERAPLELARKFGLVLLDLRAVNLVAADEQSHAGDHQQEEQRTRADHDRNLEVGAAHVLDGEHRRCSD